MQNFYVKLLMLLLFFLPGRMNGQVQVLKLVPSVSDPVPNGTISYYDSLITLANTGVSNRKNFANGVNDSKGVMIETGGIAAARNKASNDVRGIGQTFTWNNNTGMTGIGILVAQLNTSYTSSQNWKLVIHELNSFSDVGIKATKKTFSNITVTANKVSAENYLYFKFQDTVKLAKGRTYGFYLVPESVVAANQVCFLFSNAPVRGNGNQSGSLNSPTYQKWDVYNDFNFFITAESKPVFEEPSEITYLEKEHMKTQKQLYSQGNASVRALVNLLVKEAELALDDTVHSVMEKTRLIAGIEDTASKHNYMSQGKFWWFDVTRNEYVQRDGQVNPESYEISDNRYFVEMLAHCEALSLAYYFTNEEKYAVKATEILRTWFLNTATRMYPHMYYAGMVPYKGYEYRHGITDMHGLVNLTDWIGLIEKSEAFSAQDLAGIKAWYSSYLQWLVTDQLVAVPHGNFYHKNNHQTVYDLQVAAFGVWTGNTVIARQAIDSVKNRVPAQIDSSGKQPLELSRGVNKFGYSSMNLQAYFELALLGEKLNVDPPLWEYVDSEGAGMKRALDYLAPFALGENLPEFYNDKDMHRLLNFAAQKYRKDPYYALKAEKLKTQRPNDYKELLLYSFNAAPYVERIRVKKDTSFITGTTSAVSGNTEIIISNTSLAAGFPDATGSYVYSQNKGYGKTFRVTQTFTWNTTKPLTGFGILVSKQVAYPLTQEFELELHKLSVNDTSPEKTVKKWTLWAHAKDVGRNNYLYLELGVPVKLENGVKYGLHLKPVSDFNQRISFVRSNSNTVGHGNLITTETPTVYSKKGPAPDYNFYLTTLSDQLFNTNTAPVIAITSPVNNAVFNTGTAVTLSVAASDAGSVTSVAYYANDVQIGYTNNPAENIYWTPSEADTYVLKAVATDDLGAETAATVSINVVYPENGDGLTARYFNGKLNYTGTPALTRIDPVVNFNWQLNAPAPGVNADNFSVKWTGYVKALKSENYIFSTTTDDGVRLTVNGTVLINKQVNQSSTTWTSPAVALTAGHKYPVEILYYDATSMANCTLQWHSTSTPLQVIPQSLLYSDNNINARDEMYAGITDEETSKLTLYPVPAGKEVMVNIAAADDENVMVYILTPTGEIVYSQPAQLNKGMNLFRIPAEGFAKGIYVVSLGSHRKIFVKE